MQRYAEMVPLDEVACFEMGQSPRSKYVNDRGDGVPFLQGNAEFGTVTPNHELHCTRPSKLCETGDILISVRAPVGDLNKADQVYCIGRGLAAVRFEGLLPDFGWHALNYWAKDLHRFAQGTTFLAVSKSHLQQLEIICLPEAEQRRIAEILDTADAAIQQTDTVIAKLKQLKAGLLHDLLTRGLDENGLLRDPAAHPEQFKETEIGRVPREWEVARLSERASVRGGKRLPKNHQFSEHSTQYRYLHTKDFIGHEINYDSLDYLRETTFERLERYEITESELYISIAGVNLGTAGVFRPTYVDAHRTILTENAAKITLCDDSLPDFIALQMNGHLVQEQIAKRKGVGAGVPKLALHRIKSLTMLFPTIKEQERVTTAVGALDGRIRAEEAYRDKLQRVKRGLMQDLLTGRVRV